MRSRAVAVLLVTAALLAVACGTRVKDDTQASGNAGVNPPANGGGAQTTGTTAAGSGKNMIGSIENPCGPNTTGQTLTDTGLGVTANEIHVSTISDPGGPKPGLDQSLFDTMQAFGEWCNSFGGINGRKLVVDLKDAKITQYKDTIAAACQDSFALVGGMGVLDQLGAQDAVDCGIPNVPAAAVSPDVASGDLVWQPLPNPQDQYLVGPGRWIASTYPDAPPKAASLYSNFPAIKITSDRMVEGYTQIGYDFVYRQSSNVNETNWGPLVVGMKNADVKYMQLTSSFEEIIPLQQTMAQQGWHPEVTELETNFYDARYPEQAKAQGADTSNTYIRLTVWPFEEADQNPAMKSYLDILKKYVPDAVPAELGVQSWSAGLLFATAAKAAGANLTRDALESQLTNTHSWNGGGLHGKTDPGAGKPAGCFIMMKVQDGGFVRAYPLPEKDKAVYDNDSLKGMACPSDAMVTLTGTYGQGAKKKS